MLRFLAKFKYFDVPLVVAALLLVISGLALLYSVSLTSGQTDLFFKQLLFLCGGLLGFFFFAFFDYHTLAKANRVAYVAMALLLTYVLIFGRFARGGRRWFDLGLFSIQLAEFAKVVVILGLARLLYLRRGQINAWSNIAWSFLYAGIPAVLVLLEPDLGSALVILGIWAGVILTSPIQKKFILSLALAAVVLGGATWQFFLKDFQRDRILVFLNPALDPRGRGYNVTQANIAVGSGRWFGRGLGQGLQSQHKFLPERHTDFIFAASAEEVGFVGSSVILLLYLFFFSRILSVMRRARDDLGMYVAAGVFFLFFTHAVVNIAMNVGLLPVTGIPLPFFSAGGSSLAVSLIALGIIQNVAIQSKVLRF